jgi:arsenic resistance protein ArsH
VNDLPNIDPALFEAPDTGRLWMPQRRSHPPRFLMLYGSLRERSYSKLLTLEAARLLQAMGGEDPYLRSVALPHCPTTRRSRTPRCRSCGTAAWAEGMVWCSPERHGAMTGIMKARSTGSR